MLLIPLMKMWIRYTHITKLVRTLNVAGGVPKNGGPQLTMPTKKGKRKKKARLPFTITNSSTSSSELTESKGVFQEAVRGNAFGPHPGLAEVRLKAFVYNPIAKREVRLPGKQIDLLVPLVGEVDELFEVIRKAIKEWISGWTTL